MCHEKMKSCPKEVRCPIITAIIPMHFITSNVLSLLVVISIEASHLSIFLLMKLETHYNFNNWSYVVILVFCQTTTKGDMLFLVS